MSRHGDIQKAYRSLGKGGTFCGCFYVKGEDRRTDWFVNRLYTPKGFFTPPYETADSLSRRLAGMYAQAAVKTVGALACFICRKGE